jgi:hypothetical protein
VTSNNKQSPAVPRVFADFNNADRHGRLRLNCERTATDLQKQQIHLRENMELILYMEDLECLGVVVKSAEEDIWVAKIEWKDIGKWDGFTNQGNREAKP